MKSRSCWFSEYIHNRWLAFSCYTFFFISFSFLFIVLCTWPEFLFPLEFYNLPFFSFILFLHWRVGKFWLWLIEHTIRILKKCIYKLSKQSFINFYLILRTSWTASARDFPECQCNRFIETCHRMIALRTVFWS